MPLLICLRAEGGRGELWMQSCAPTVPVEERDFPLILGDKVGRDPDSLGAGHVPQHMWGLHSASFGNSGPLGFLATGSVVSRD